jgi:hypothetical protein
MVKLLKSNNWAHTVFLSIRSDEMRNPDTAKYVVRVVVGNVTVSPLQSYITSYFL